MRSIMIALVDKKDCVGCGACMAACPKKCITMSSDTEGFFYPKVNKNYCIDCNLCEKVCPVINNEIAVNSENVKAYGMYSDNKQLVEKSSSGGVFTELANAFFSKYPSGLLYGAILTKELKVRHECISSIDEIDQMQGSKYVQSDLTEVYWEIKRFLEDGFPVYFSGTPCQIAALNKFLGKKYDTFFTQAILCHGVPSPLTLEIYLKSVEQKYDAKVENIRFRDKTYGWYNYAMTLELDNGRVVIENSKRNSFLRAFGAGIDLRPSCYNCRFKYPNWTSDITLGDFWNVESLAPSIYNKRGTSIVFVNSDKGEKLINRLGEKVTVRRVVIDMPIKGQHGIVASTPENKNRSLFFSNVNSEEFDSIVQRLTSVSFKNKVRAYVARTLRNAKYRLYLIKKGHL